MKITYKIIATLICVWFLSHSLIAQDNAAKIRQLVESKKYTFAASRALPQRGRAINLNGSYTLHVSTDTITASLPYFGRAYSPPIGSAEGGIKFTSTKFTYDRKPGKKGGHEISILINDSKDVRELRLSISESGYATMGVTSNNRAPISFYGEITEGTK